MATTSSPNTLWMIKFASRNDSLSSLHRHVTDQQLGFVKAFKSVIDQHNVSLIYAGGNGPSVVYIPKITEIPTNDWDITMITDHSHSNAASFDDIQNSTEFKALNESEYAPSIVYNTDFKINEMSRNVSIWANISQFISRFIGFFGNSIDPTFGLCPPYPFKSAAFDFLKKINGSGHKESMSNILRFTQYGDDQPFLMLNLMQIRDAKSDKKYVSGVVPLLFASGGRPCIIGGSKGHWNQVLFVYYPNTRAFFEMVSSTNYAGKDMVENKWKSTKDCFVGMTVPIFCQNKFCIGNMPSKL